MFDHTTNLLASMSTLEGENFRSVVHLEKRVLRPDQRDDFDKQEPSDVLSAEIGFSNASESSWMTEEVQVVSANRIWMLFLEVMKLMYFFHLCRHSHLDVILGLHCHGI